MAAQPQTQPPPETRPQDAPDISAVLAVDDAAVNGVAPPTIKAAAVAPLVAGKLAASAFASAVKAILAAFLVFQRKRSQSIVPFLAATVQRQFPERTPAEVRQIASAEVKFEAEFRSKQIDRLRRDLPDALKHDDPADRAADVKRILDREKLYTQMREQAMVERAVAAANMQTVKEMSPLGAYWRLSRTVHEHTPDCLALGEKFWPWEVLDKIHPPLHVGCPCELYTLDEAVGAEWMDRDQVPNTKDAVAHAARIMRQFKHVREAAFPGEIDAAVTDLIEASRKKDNPECEAETARIKASAATAKGKARHLFQAAKWTHPNGHPRCKVCGQEEDIGGVCNGKPTVAEAQAWADRENKDGMWGESKWTVGKAGKLLLGLEEAQRRYAKGTVQGGEFMPRDGVGVPVRPIIRRALRDLVHLGTPRERRRAGAGRSVWLRGSRTTIPEQREYARTIGGIHYTSPMGSTTLYRNGVPMDDTHPELQKGATAAPYDLGLNSHPDAAVRAMIASSRDQKTQTISERVGAALADPSYDIAPISAGDDSVAAHEALQNHGFVVADLAPAKAGHRITYLHPETGSQVTVTHSEKTGRVLAPTWEPGVTRSQSIRPLDEQLTRPPRSWTEFRRNVATMVHDTAAAHGDTPRLTGIEQNSALSDHTGVHTWEGVIELGRDAQPDLMTMMARRETGVPLTDRELRNTYAAYKVAIHEGLHAAAPLSQDDYQKFPEHRAMEEALTEELAMHYAVEMLRREGQTDVLAWMAQNPLDTQMLGTYWGFRAGLDRLLNEVGVAPEERPGLQERLKFDAKANGRFDLLGEVTGRNPRTLQAIARSWVEVPLMNFPTAPPNVGGSADDDARWWHDEKLWLGATVNYARPSLTPEARVTDLEGATGRIISFEAGTGPVGWLATIEGTDGRVSTVVPSQITDIVKSAPMTLAADGDTSTYEPVAVGDTVSYDGIDDGSFSEAKVTRVLSDTPGAWIIEAVTTDKSKVPGTAVYLTPERTGRILRKVEAETHVPVDVPSPPVTQLDTERAFGVHRELAVAGMASPGVAKGTIVSILGLPGSGKGTIGKAVAGALGVPHLSAGDMLRDLPRDSELGRQVYPFIDRGELAPTPLVEQIVQARLSQPDAVGGVVLDGSPRTMDELRSLEKFAGDSGRPIRFVELAVPKHVAVARIAKRAAEEDRADDNPEVVSNRLRVYDESIQPVIDQIGREGNLTSVDVSGPSLDANVAAALSAVTSGSEPPKFKRVGPGVYDSEDGRLTMYRIEGVNPPAWNIDLHTDYAWEQGESEHADLRDLSTSVVDGAASMRDALAIMRRDWPETAVRLARIESSRGMSSGTPDRRVKVFPDAASMAVELVPTDWQVEHGYAEHLPQIGFRAKPYKPVPGGREKKEALRMLHDYLTGKPEDWTGSRKQVNEMLKTAEDRWLEHIKAEGWTWLSLADVEAGREVPRLERGMGSGETDAERFMRFGPPITFTQPREWAGRKHIISAIDAEKQKLDAARGADPQSLYIHEPDRNGEVGSVTYRLDEGDKAVEIDLALVNKERRGEGIGVALLAELAKHYPPSEWAYQSSTITAGGEAVLRAAIRRGVFPAGRWVEDTSMAFRGRNVVRWDSQPSLVAA